MALALLSAWFALENGWQPLAALLSAAALHELGHLAALRCCGVWPTAFCLSPFGAELEFPAGRLSYGQELLAALAGPGANFLCAVGLSWAARRGLPAFFFSAAGAHAVLGAFNLLPLCPLDGGRALRLLLTWALGPGAGEALSAALGALCGLGAAGGLLYLSASSGGSLWLLPACGWLVAAALREGARVPLPGFRRKILRHRRKFHCFF
jgi:stage IV sporulation protein FB